MQVKDRRLSFYRSLTRTTANPITVSNLANCISDRESEIGSYQQQCVYYNELVRANPQKAKQYKAVGLPAYSPTGIYLRSKNKRKLTEPSGLIWVDFDDAPHPANIREQLGKLPNCVLCYISVSGSGVHLLLATSVMPANPEHYGQLWDYVVRQFIPSELHKYIDPASRRLAQLAIISTDTAAFVNLEPEITKIVLPPPEPKPKHKPNYKPLSSADTAKQQMHLYNLLDRTRPPADYLLWIKLLASLKAGGINESVANSWSQRGSNYTKTGFLKAWKSLSAYGGISIGTFIWWTKNN